MKSRVYRVKIIEGIQVVDFTYKRVYTARETYKEIHLKRNCQRNTKRMWKRRTPPVSNVQKRYTVYYQQYCIGMYGTLEYALQRANEMNRDPEKTFKYVRQLLGNVEFPKGKKFTVHVDWDSCLKSK